MSKKLKRVPKVISQEKTADGIRLEIACGQRKNPDWIGIDRVKTEQTDIVHDLNKCPWPIESDSVLEAQCSHYIEHIPMLCSCCAHLKDPLFSFFDELYRVMAVGAKCLIICPFWTSSRCWQDPTHRRAISEFTFLYANKGWRIANGLSHYDVSADFDFTYGYVLAPEAASKALEAQQFWVNHYVNAVYDLQVTLVKRAPAA
jgi:hypothetical protein